MGRSSERLPIPAAITEIKIVAIVRGLGRAEVLEVAPILLGAGIRALEVTLDTPDALDTIAALTDRFGDELTIGAGTVRSVEGVLRAVDAGARFTVSPNVDADVLAQARQSRVPALAGAFTATEAQFAWNEGAAAVKLFPADVLGPSYLKSLRAPLEDIPFVPTGGVSAGNAEAWLRAGAVALGVGSWLLSGRLESAVVARCARGLMQAVARA